jgi:DNA polymerase I
VAVVSGDRDLMQTALPPVELLFVGRRGQPGERYDRAAVEARFGVGPERLASYAAMIGDNSDNITGVSGIGPRAAAKLVQQFGDVAGILAHAEAIEPPRLREIVLGAQKQLVENEALTRLRDDVPLPEGELYRSLDGAAHERLRTLFEELEFRSLLPRLAKLAS